MAFRQCCKDCSCWCIFTISTVILLVSTGLAISDMGYMAETKEAIDIVLNSPAPQLRCLEVCRTWFSEESGQSCCDRYNSNLCLEKAVCKEDFLSASEVDLQVIRNDAQSQLMTAVLCLITMIVIAFFQFNQHQLEHKLQKRMERKIQTAIDQALSDKICRVQLAQSGEVIDNIETNNLTDKKDLFRLDLYPVENCYSGNKQKRFDRTV